MTGTPGVGTPERRTPRRAALIALVLALLAGATAAFAFTEKLKLEERAVTAAKIRRAFSPTCGCRTQSTIVVVRLREPGSVAAQIVEPDGRHVRTLEPASERRSREARFRWDGRDDGGELVRDGIYRLRVRLVDDDRTILIPKAIRLDTVAPRLELVAVRPRVIESHDELAVTFTTDEGVRAALIVDEEPVARGGFRRPGRRTITWDATSGGSAVRPGPRELVLRVRDRAGNVTASEAVTVRIGSVNAVYSDAAPRLPAHELADNANEGAMIMSTGVRRAMEMGDAPRLSVTRARGGATRHAQGARAA